MEKNEDFQRVVASIKQLEQKLQAIDENATINKKYVTEAETEIEEYFAKCMNALAVRKDTLLRDLTMQISNQHKRAEDSRKELKGAIEVRKKLLETGTFIYNADIKTAEHVWKGVTNLSKPQVTIQRTKIDFSNPLLEAIQTHGKVLLVKNDEEGEEAEGGGDVPIAIATETTLPACLYSIVDNVVNFVGATPGLADGKGEKAKFNTPRGICWNPRDECLYVCDKRNNSIRKITLQGEVSTFVRGSDGQLSWPQEIVMHHKTNTFFATNEYAHNIVKITSGGSVSVLAGNGKMEYKDGLGANASFCYPTGIAIDQQSGSLFVSDYNNHAIRVITPEGEVSTLAGSQTNGDVDGNGVNARFNGPWGLFFDGTSQSILVCDYDNDKLRRVKLNGEVTTVCTIPRPSLACTANGVTLVASDDSKMFTISKEGVVSVLAQQEKEREREGTKTKGHMFGGIIGLAVHEPSRSCFLVGGHVIRRVTFK